MNILIIGKGGREHALAFKIAQSPKVNKIYCAPSNSGIAEIAEPVNININNIDALADFALQKNIQLTVVGPEKSLALGIVDTFEKKDLKIFGPSKKAAQIEASKSFAKKIMAKANIPTPKSETFTDINKANQYIKKQKTPIVIKADGLAAGKGVIICDTTQKALNTAGNMLVKNQFGKSGKKILIEEYAIGKEASFIAFCDGTNILPFPLSCDHKPAFDNNKGPNTGGMGVYSPAPFINKTLYKKIAETIILPAVKTMKKSGAIYKGFLYAGLIINNDNVKVLEFNCRMGDPEAQALLVRVKNDIIEIMEACIQEKLNKFTLDINKKASVCVIMASSGYPNKTVEKGALITGLEKITPKDNLFIFHSGTKKKNNNLTTNGGRVLGITALGNNIENASKKAYNAIKQISWKGAFYRKDIGKSREQHI
ncbi:MAG: phosphoribosylamine--glycine ligase [Deltaproteobacteria bacterium]|nr:phosphoribosylamine--glycine ligase [Deltaproteobacteria bacterium]